MSSVRIEINDAAIQELLKSEEMQAIVGEYASQKAAEAGDGYGYNVKVGEKRCYANIFPETKDAWKDLRENNTLEKVIRSAE